MPTNDDKTDDPSVPIYQATELMQGGGTALIKLGTQEYTLRITRAGKLILTK